MKKSELLNKTREMQEYLDTLMQLIACNHFSQNVKETVESYTQLFINKTRLFEQLIFGSDNAKYTRTSYSWGSPITTPALRIDRDERALQMKSTKDIAQMKQQIYDWIYNDAFIEDDPSETNVNLPITKTVEMTAALTLMRTYIDAIDTAIIQNTPSDAS